jgi:hypothetical protein
MLGNVNVGIWKVFALINSEGLKCLWIDWDLGNETLDLHDKIWMNLWLLLGENMVA